MAAQVSSRDTFCTFTYFDCFSKKDEGQRINDQQSSHDVSIKRETLVQDQQPHLVEPMKLTVYEDLPCTPLSAHHTITTPRPFFSRAMTASRASSRASLSSLRKMVSRHSLSISTPTPAPITYEQRQNVLPLRRRRREFRPLELSIYVDSKRLSDLPEFNRFSFTEFGELKNLGQVLSRPQSAVLPPCRDTDLNDIDADYKPKSMYEIGSRKSSRPQTSYSVLSMSRPPSEYDALHSHPVSWSTLPGLSVQTQHSKQDKAMMILTPMQEEFPSEPAAVSVGDTILKFPQAQPSFFAATDAQPPIIDLAAPAPVVRRISNHGRRLSRSLDDLKLSPNRSRHMHKRSISQWLASRARSHSTSTSTISSTSTSRSFAEHRRKRSEFYLLSNEMHVPVALTTTSLMLQSQQYAEQENASRNKSLHLVDDAAEKHETDHTQNEDSLAETHRRTPNEEDYHHHQRTVTDSTVASTIDTDILSDSTYSHNDNDSSRCLRSNTIRSISSPGGCKPMTAVVNEKGLVAPMRGQVYIVNDEYDGYNDDDNSVISQDGHVHRRAGDDTLKGFRHVIGAVSNDEVGDGFIQRPTVVGVAF